MLHSMFCQVDISLNGTLISSSTDIYLYRAVFKMLLSCRANAKKLQVTSELYYKDTACSCQSCEFNVIGCIHGVIFQENYHIY